MLEDWSEFGVAMAGATAALAGLIIVAISVNLEIIVKYPPLPPRAATAIGTLVLACIASCLLLVPGAPLWAYGLEVLIGSAVAWVLAGFAIARISRNRYGSRTLQALTAVVPIAAFTVAGVLLLVGLPVGVSVVALAAVLSIVSGVLTSWVTLVEIRR